MPPESQTSAVMPLRRYQQRWIDDSSRFKIAVKSARIGFSFATALEAVLDSLEHATTWTVLCPAKHQATEFIDAASKMVELMTSTVDLYSDEDWYDEMGKIEAIQQRITFANGSRIIALPANPRTARGYPGNVILDEFAHFEDSYAVWAAVTRQVALGHKMRVLSTPNGEQGKYYDLCKELGLTDGIEPEDNFEVRGGWCRHWIDARMAIADGCPIDMRQMRDLIKDDTIVDQEFNCVFLQPGGAWLPLDMIVSSEDSGATIDWPDHYVAQGRLFMGIDVGRARDATIAWIKEQIGDVLWTRSVIALYSMPFDEQASRLAPYVRLCDRVAIDSTGMGIALYDLLNVNARGRVLGVNFAGSSRTRNEDRAKATSIKSQPDGSIRLKTDLAVRIKRSHEQGKERIPYDLQIRAELQAIKRVATASGVTFDAPRVEIPSPVPGANKKSFAHADRFWAHALATYAADMGSAIDNDFDIPALGTASSAMGGY